MNYSKTVLASPGSIFTVIISRVCVPVVWYLLTQSINSSASIPVSNIFSKQMQRDKRGFGVVLFVPSMQSILRNKSTMRAPR